MNPNPMNQQFEMLMNQLMQTSNAAIRAAEAANALMTSLSTSTSSSGNGSSKELYKLIFKPSVFAQENKEQEIGERKKGKNGKDGKGKQGKSKGYGGQR